MEVEKVALTYKSLYFNIRISVKQVFPPVAVAANTEDEAEAIGRAI